MKKNESVKYLSDVFMGGCVTHTLFDRCSADERERYSELVGKERAVVENMCFDKCLAARRWRYEFRCGECFY